MGQFYTNPSRESNPTALPDAEVWEEDGTQLGFHGDTLEAGWYWWACFPGCLEAVKEAAAAGTDCSWFADGSR